MKRKFSSTIITPNRENIPNHIRRWYKKPREYEGAGAIVARPGTIVPRVHRDAKVVCKVIWVSDVYFDDNGRSRKDVAFELCMGPIDGVIRIEAGEDRIPIFNYLGIDDVVSGHQFYKSLEVKTGEFDQTQSLFIENREGDADTPYFPGLAYFVLKGFKLWKWPNRAIPYMEAVVLRNIAEATSDEYADSETFYYRAGTNVDAIAGEPDSDILYVSYPFSPAYKVTLSTNTWVDIGTAGNAAKGKNSLVWFKDELYVMNRSGLYKYSGSGTTWITIDSLSGLQQTFIGHNDDYIVYHYSTAGNRVIKSYDGTTVNTIPYPNDYKLSNCVPVVRSNNDVFFLPYKTSSDSALFFLPGAKIDGSGVSGDWSIVIAAMDNSVGPDMVTDTGGTIHIVHGDQAPSPDELLYTTYLTSDNTEVIRTISSLGANDIDFFSNRAHVTNNESGNPSVRRRESLSNWTSLPIPSTPSTPNQTYNLQRVGNKLFCGTNIGFFQVQDA